MPLEQNKKNDETKLPLEDLLFNKDVLIVDDDATFRSMLKAVLENFSCNVKEASNGLEGLQLLQHALPDILLCDLAMPILNGMEFVEEVALTYPMLPIIVVSGSGDIKDVAKVLRLGAKDYIVKPIRDISILVKSISSALKLSEESSQGPQDFSSQWFRTSELDKDYNDELHWHLDSLRKEPNVGRKLLFELLPENDAYRGNWKLSYRLLQSADVMPLIFDYEWLLDGRLFFYFVDSSSGGDNGVISCLLIRAFFNDFLREQNTELNTMPKLIASIEKGLSSIKGSQPISAMFGYVDFATDSVSIISAGLDAIWDNQKERSVLHGNKRLIEGADKNTIYQYQIAADNNLLLNNLGLSSFKLELSTSADK